MTGYILKAHGTTRHYFATFIRGDMQYVEDPDYAWFTTDRDVASAMVLGLAVRAGEEFEIVPHSHPGRPS